MYNELDNIKDEDVQNIFESILQALGDDHQEARNHMELRTGISSPFLKWDLLYRNLMNRYDKGNLKYSVTKRGMWEVLLLYDENSKLIISFMRKSRFLEIKSKKSSARPRYIQALLTLNEELQAPNKQVSLFKDDSQNNQTELEKTLDELCANFIGYVDTKNSRHILAVFSSNYGTVDSLTAYLLDKDLDIVCEKDWLEVAKPIISTMPESASDTEEKAVPELKPKALERIHEKELVSIKKPDTAKEA